MIEPETSDYRKSHYCLIVHWRYARCWWHLTLHMINVERTFHVFFFIFFFFIICVCITWAWLGWGCFDVLFFIFEFHFLFLLIFILFSRACLYMCNWCFPLRCLFQCLLVCLFVLLFYFGFIPFLYLFIVYVMWLYFIIFSLKLYLALKRDYHILFV